MTIGNITKNIVETMTMPIGKGIVMDIGTGLGLQSAAVNTIIITGDFPHTGNVIIARMVKFMVMDSDHAIATPFSDRIELRGLAPIGVLE